MSLECFLWETDAPFLRVMLWAWRDTIGYGYYGWRLPLRLRLWRALSEFVEARA